MKIRQSVLVLPADPIDGWKNKSIRCNTCGAGFGKPDVGRLQDCDCWEHGGKWVWVPDGCLLVLKGEVPL